MERNSYVEANCSNCEYVKYKHTDGVRFERCDGFRIGFENLPTNPLAEELVLNDGKNLCEKYQFADSLRQEGMEVVYF